MRPCYDKRVGCSSCKTKGGCAEHKGPQREVIAATLAAVYPSGRWGELDDEAAFGRGSDWFATRRLGRAIASAARAPVDLVEGRDGDLCHYIYVLCVGRQPGLIELREQGGVPEADVLTEQYLRVVVSTIAPVASVQECAVTWQDGLLSETLRPGVYDPKLLKRMRAIVATIESSGLEHIDFGLVDAPSGLEYGDYVERYGCTPKLVNYLYYPQPVDTATISTLALAEGEAFVATEPDRQDGVEPDDGAREHDRAEHVHAEAS